MRPDSGDGCTPPPSTGFVRACALRRTAQLLLLLCPLLISAAQGQTIGTPGNNKTLPPPAGSTSPTSPSLPFAPANQPVAASCAAGWSDDFNTGTLNGRWNVATW